MRVRKIILSLFLVSIVVFAYHNIVLAKTYTTSAKTGYKHKTVYENYKESDYKYNIKIKKSGILKVSVDVETEEDDEYSYYGFFDVSIDKKNGEIIKEIESPVTSSHRCHKKKSIKIPVGNGDVVQVWFSGLNYSYVFEWNTKKMTKPYFVYSNKHKKSYSISWYKLDKVKKYEVQVSTNKKFKKNVRRKYVKMNKLNISGFKKKKYYLRVRGIGKKKTKWSSTYKLKK